jgi:exodeoxyribonuclease VII large subunit
MQRIDFFELTLVQTQTRKLSQLRNQLLILKNKLSTYLPQYRINMLSHQCKNSHLHLLTFLKNLIKEKKGQINLAAQKFHALSPLATLDRGYAIAIKGDTIIPHINVIKKGDKIDIRLKNGLIRCLVEEIIE